MQGRHVWAGLVAALTAAAVAAPSAGAHGLGHGSPEPVAAQPAAGAPVTLAGTLERLHGHADRALRHEVSGWALQTRAGRRYGLRFARGARTLAPQTAVTVRGTLRRGVVTATAVRRRPRARAAATSTIGSRRTAVVLFNFADDQSRPFSVEDARAAIFTGATSVNAFYQAESHGRLSLIGRDSPQGDVHDWVTVPSSKATCNSSTVFDWTYQADVQLRSRGVNLAGYDHVIYAHPKAACGWAGIASVGGRWSAFNGTLALWVAGHEIGHNYGFEHAGKAYCRSGGALVAMAVDLSSCDLTREYDDPYDIMGNRETRHSSAIRQAQAGWIPQANLRTLTADATVRLAPSNQTLPGAAQAILIPRGDRRTEYGRTRDLFYWLEFRRPDGGFDAFQPGDAVVNGVTIRVAGPAEDPGTTWLIDTNPATAWSVKDEPLTPGQTFSDLARAINVTTLSAGPDGADVRVSFGAGPPPTPPPPAAVADTQAPSIPGGVTATVTGAGVELAWAPASDNVGVTSYRVYRNGAPKATTTATSYLSPGDSGAIWQVAAVDAAGNVGALSAPVVAARPATPRPKRLAVERARSGGRAVAVARLAAADGRAVRATDLELGFKPAAGTLAPSLLELRLKAARACAVELKSGGRWSFVARIPAAKRFKRARVDVPALETDGRLDLRLRCGGRAVDVDAAALIL